MNLYGFIIASALMMAIPPVMADDHINWIYFRDKGINPLQTGRHAVISQRSISRRGRVLPRHRILSREDAPVREQYIDVLRRMGVRIRHRSRWLNAVSVSMSDSLDSSIRSLPFVRDIRPVRVSKRYTPRVRPATLPDASENNRYGISYNQISQIGVDKLHSLGYTGSGVLICMMDTGFYKDHISLRDRHVLAERDFVFFDDDTQRDADNPDDYSDSHGTATWSAAGGYDSGELIGPAYGATFILAKTEDLRFERPVEEDNWIAAVEWADSIGADIISSSLAYTLFDDGTGYSFDDLDGNTAATTIVADRAASLGIAVVVAAGNYRTTMWGHIGTPADGDSVISVGAVNADGVIASFSSPGPTADGRIKPEVCAQGVNTYCANNALYGYTYKNGTSLGTPLVAGASALLLEVHPSWTGAEIRTALLNSASQWDHPDTDYGWGIIDAFLASGLEALFLEITSFTVDDDSLGGSRGNDNGYVEAGEILELGVSVRNTGSIAGGSLSGILSSEDDRVLITHPFSTLPVGDPGDSSVIGTPFICMIADDVQGNVDIPLMITFLSDTSDTVHVSDLILPVRDIVHVAGTVENIETTEPIPDARVSVIEQEKGYICSETTTDGDGRYEFWLEPSIYSLFASGEGYTGTDGVLWRAGAGDTTLYLAQPVVTAHPGSILIAAIPDTILTIPFRIVNESRAPLTVSVQEQSVDPLVTVPALGPGALRTDTREGFNHDIAAIFGNLSSAFLAIKTSFHEPVELDGTYRLHIGIDADDDTTNGLPVAGLNADYLIEVWNNGMLYAYRSGTWQFQSFLTIEEEDSSLTVSVPRTEITSASNTLKLACAIEILDGSGNPGDVLPDITGTCPVLWELERPQWIRSDSTFQHIPPGGISDQSIRITTRDIPMGTYVGSLVLQGGIPEELRIPVIMELYDTDSGTPRELVITSTFPNPFHDHVDLMVSVPRRGELRTALIDIAGRSIQRWDPVVSEPGIQWYRLDMNPSIAPGVYVISVRAAEGQVFSEAVIRKWNASAP